MYLYAPPFSIVKKEKETFRLSDVLGGKYEFSKRLLTQTLGIIGKNEKTLGGKQKEIAQNLLEVGFLERTKYSRGDYFDYEKVKNSIEQDLGKVNDLMNIGSVTFALIKQCPYSCEECYAKDRIRKEDSGDFKEKDLYKTIEQMSKKGLKDISISGGEPTTSKKTLEKTLKIAEISEKFNIPSRLITTGYGLKEFSNELFSSPIKHYQISIDGLKEYNDRYKKYPGATERSMDAIKRCKDHGKEYSINTVITKENLEQLGEFVEFLEKNSANNLRIAKIISSNPEKALNIEESKRLKEKIEKIKVSSEMDIKSSYDDDYIQKDNVDCVAGKLYAHIDCYGELFPCAFMQDISLGNIYGEDFDELWNLENSEIRTFQEGIIPAGSCIKCDDRYHCFSNCRKEYEIKNGQRKNGP